MAKSGPRPQADVSQAFAEAVNLYRLGRLAEAERIAGRILKALPQSYDALHLLGLIKLGCGWPAAALALLDTALKRRPGAPEALSNRGLALAALGRDAEALASIDAALAAAPDNADALNNRGNVLLKLARPADALASLDRAVALKPGHFGASISRGNALASLGRFVEALAQYGALLAAQPASAELHFNRGNALAGLSRQADAIAAYDRAIALRPDHLKHHLNRGIALQRVNRHKEAIASFERALSLDKSDPDARHNAALARLTLGDYRGGFELYEARWERSGMAARRRSLGKPLWLGEYPLQRKTVMLMAEQGLGDTVQFARYVRPLAGMGAKVVLEVPSELTSLLGRIAGVSRTVARGEALPEFDVHCPMGSLPLALRTEVSTIPAAIPYLTADEVRLAKWRSRLGEPKRPRVALAWSGRAAHPNDRNRSVALGRLAPLLDLEGIDFISVQRELRQEDAQMLADLPRLRHLGHELNDFDDTAAVLALVDLVISVDTALAHLAGAMGRPTWILLPLHPDWRWMLEREDSPWYPTARLYRQTAAGDWESVIGCLRTELARRLIPA
jgi:tetratricopeptide (TPR) repeat protein